ncbi:MAG: NUDIX hydrolase [Methylosarcina sp.]
MINELLCVVDENDCVLEVCARQIIHAAGLRHRAVHIMIFDELGRLFLQKRSLKKDLNAGLWDTSAAGHVDAGEDYESSALREIEEELSITGIPRLEPLFKLAPTVETGMEFVQVYRIRHNGPFVLAPDEIDEGGWFYPAEISEKVRGDDPNLTETFKRLWRHLEFTAS